MTLESIITTGIALLAVIVSPYVYIWNSLTKKIEKLEEQLETKVDKEFLKEVLDTKLDSMTKDLVETKQMLNKLLDIQLQKKD